MLIKAFIITAAAGYLGAVLGSLLLGWEDAGAVVAVAVMGTFILRAIRSSKGRDDN